MTETDKTKPVFIMARMNPKGRAAFVRAMREADIMDYETYAVGRAEEAAKLAYATQSAPVMLRDDRTIELKQSWFDYVVLDR